MAWDFSCIDWEDRITDGRSLIPKLALDEKIANRALGVFNSLKLPDVPGTPALEDASGEWFRDVVAALFGSLENGARMVRELFLMIPKKNSKTTNGAALMLVALMMNRRPRAEFLLIGPTQAISELAFNQAVGMIATDPELSRLFKIQDHIKKITYRGSVVSSLQIKTFDASVLTGVKPVGVLIDELHELGKISGAANVIRQIRGGLLPFPEAFLVFITTQSDKPPAGAFKAELLKARKIRDGKIPARGMLPVLYEFPRALIDNGAWRDLTGRFFCSEKS
jgi:phage terminase large subunit-like protein